MAVDAHCIKLSKTGGLYPFVRALGGSNLTVSPTTGRSLHSRQIKTNSDDDLPDRGSFLEEKSRLESNYEVQDMKMIQSSNVITTSSTIILPFSASVAYDAFSDVTRQPSWSPWLYSVSYIDDGMNARSETEWKMKLFGFQYSWRAISTRLDRPHFIEWQSTSGLRNGGRVQFEPLRSESGEVHCKMTMTMNFIAPTPVVLMFPNKIESLFRKVILKRTLYRFKEVVAAENAI